LLKAHTDLYKIIHKFITPYHSKGNGFSERLHQTLSTMISHFVNQTEFPMHNTWDKHLMQLQWAYNSTTQESLTMSPSKVIYGREPSFPYDYNLPNTIHQLPILDFQELREQVKF